MKMTKKREEKLISLLQKGYVSLPELQSKMKISYKEACSLLAYAFGHKWIGKCTEGIDFPVIVCHFSRKELSEDLCNEVYERLSLDALHVLYYLAKRFNATRSDLIENVEDDEADLDEAIALLTDNNLIFLHESCYYCRIAQKSTQRIQKIEKTNLARRARLLQAVRPDDDEF